MVTIPAVELDSPEVTPYRAGYRAAAADPVRWVTMDYDLAAITAILTGPERLAMVRGDPKTFTRWVVIGMMQAIVDHYINKVRAV